MSEHAVSAAEKSAADVQETYGIPSTESVELMSADTLEHVER